ncbi:hypothetical protein VF21_10215 [Pseudogymnoascus sp. 05NY08]|nr:hypothetical protein VF21_10215 [Pseudogymnoascus sp. 05NY08]
MDVLNAAAQQLIDEAQRFSAFTGLVKPNPEDRFFLVMGKTGSGKSTFVARCTGEEVTVGHGLYSCTSSIDSYSYTLPSPRDSHSTRRIHLIDTPGFDDTTRSDIKTLGILASYLGASYANGDGWIKCTKYRDVKELCGFTSYENVAIATTMWPQTSSDDPLGESSHNMTALYQREVELLTDQRFWGEFAAKETAMFRHNKSGRRDGEGETTSARNIVSHLIAESDNNSTLKVLRLQREIIDEKKTLDETAAGIAIAGDLYKARKEHEQQLLDLETELKERLAMADASHDEELQELKSEIQMTMAKAQEETKALQKSMELELEELEDSVRQIREEANILRWSAETEREFSEHTEIVRSASTEVVNARDAHSKFNSSMTDILDELANGILDGVRAIVMTEVLAAGKLLCTVM